MDIRLPSDQREAIDDAPGAWRSASPRWRLIGGIVAAILAVVLARYLLSPHSPQQVSEPPAPVRVAVARTQTVIVLEHTIGTIVANATVQVTSRVEGQLVAARFKEGDIVHKGDLLFQLDPRPFQAALAQAVATENRDQAQLTSAHNDAARYASLAAQGAASKSQADQFVAAAKALAATIAADRAMVEAARLNVTYTQIRSPIDGKTGPILIQPGNMVPASGTNPLVTITQIQPVKVSFFLPQSDLPRIQDQMHSHRLNATLAAHDSANTRLTAPVDFVGNEVDNTTGTVELRATFDNRDYRLVPGQLLDVSVSLAELPNAVVVPREAVNQGPQGRFIYVAGKDDKAEMRPVSVLNDDGRIDAVSGDIRAGDRVITDGQLRVVAGKPIAIARSRGGAPQPDAR
jgi:multidrug efflux system membrane fusion protein